MASKVSKKEREQQFKKLIKMGLWNEEKRLKSCMGICTKMDIDMVHVGKLRFVLKNSDGTIIGFNGNKDIKELQYFLSSHEYVDGNFIKKKNEENV